MCHPIHHERNEQVRIRAQNELKKFDEWRVVHITVRRSLDDVTRTKKFRSFQMIRDKPIRLEIRSIISGIQSFYSIRCSASCCTRSINQKTNKHFYMTHNWPNKFGNEQKSISMNHFQKQTKSQIEIKSRANRTSLIDAFSLDLIVNFISWKSNRRYNERRNIVLALELPIICWWISSFN